MVDAGSCQHQRDQGVSKTTPTIRLENTGYAVAAAASSATAPCRSRKAVGRGPSTRQARQRFLAPARPTGDGWRQPAVASCPNLLDAVGDTIRSDVPVEPRYQPSPWRRWSRHCTASSSARRLSTPRRTTFAGTNLTAIRAMAAKLLLPRPGTAPRSVADPKAPRARRSRRPLRRRGRDRPRPALRTRRRPPQGSSVVPPRPVRDHVSRSAVLPAGRASAGRAAATPHCEYRVGVGRGRVAIRPRRPQAEADPHRAEPSSPGSARASTRTVTRAPLGRQPGEGRQELLAAKLASAA